MMALGFLARLGSRAAVCGALLEGGRDTSTVGKKFGSRVWKAPGSHVGRIYDLLGMATHLTLSSVHHRLFILMHEKAFAIGHGLHEDFCDVNLS